MARQNRSKYNFGKLKVGETFNIHPRDEYSMKNSLNHFNKKHGTNIVVETEDVSETVTKVKRVEHQKTV